MYNRVKQAPPKGTQSSRSHMRPFVAALLLIAGGAWLALALQAGSIGLMPVTMGSAMPSFVVMWTLMVAAMMVPSITPLASRYLCTIESPWSFGLLGFTAGYLGVWTTTGVLAFALAWLAGRIAATSPLAATVTAAAIFCSAMLRGAGHCAMCGWVFTMGCTAWGAAGPSCS